MEALWQAKNKIEHSMSSLKKDNVKPMGQDTFEVQIDSKMFF